MGKKSQSHIYKGKVLVVNDEPGICNRIARELARLGYQCTFVGSTFEAEALLGHEHFDTIVYGHEFLLDRTSPRLPTRIR